MSQSLGEILVQRGLLSPDQLREASTLQRTGSLGIEAAVVRLGFLDESAVARTVAAVEGLPFVDLDKGRIAPETLARVPKEMAVEQGILPVLEKGGKLVVAIDDLASASCWTSCASCWEWKWQRRWLRRAR